MTNLRNCLTASSILLAMSTGAALGQEQSGGRGGRRGDGGLKVGQEAPTFSLKSLDGKDKFGLEGYRGKKPVVLFFGSYT